MWGKNKLRYIDRKSWNGHTHSEFCPHGSGEKTELFIERAIQCGFRTYSITEHFPLPDVFYSHPVGSRHAIYTAAMFYDELPKYFEMMNYLKEKYKDQIQILVGFEFDYIEKYRDWYAEQFRKFHSQIDDAILSIHFLPTQNGLRAVDDSIIDFKSGVLEHCGSPLGVAKTYLKTVNDALDWRTRYKPFRYGHIMLYRKWRNLFPNNEPWEDNQTRNTMNRILTKIANQNLFLDCNMAGLYRKTETESSPNEKWLTAAQKIGIPLVYGSDAHKVRDVSQGFNTYLENRYYKS
ncbi:histidinol-phosphatase HisJ [Lentilactobacillus raoultii]|uniref:Histidinol-phosphatase n=1 Tax=Lentilactobacillus raoultii TaxID=1987503 RepID=A0ABW3PP40_9LACO|nr:histidinol-phosphatase HisJ [Lentilactobacillus raoultii]